MHRMVWSIVPIIDGDGMGLQLLIDPVVELPDLLLGVTFTGNTRLISDDDNFKIVPLHPLKGFGSAFTPAPFVRLMYEIVIHIDGAVTIKEKSFVHRILLFVGSCFGVAL